MDVDARSAACVLGPDGFGAGRRVRLGCFGHHSNAAAGDVEKVSSHGESFTVDDR